MHVITPAIFLAALLIFIWRVVAVTLLYSASIGVIIALINAPIVALGNSTGVGYWIGHAVNSRFGSAPLFLAREALTYCQDNIFLLPYPGYPGTEQAAELWALRPQYEHSPIESLADPHISGAIYRYGWALRRCDLFGTVSFLFTRFIGVSVRIYYDGCCGTPRTVSLLLSEEVEKESIEERSGRSLHLLSPFLLCSTHRARTRILLIYHTSHVYSRIIHWRKETACLLPTESCGL